MGCVLQALAECIASRLAVAWCCAGAVGVVVCAMQWQEHLQDIFSWYANFGRTAAQSRAETMDSFMFMKFAKECPGLLQGGYVAGLVLGRCCIAAHLPCGLTHVPSSASHERRWTSSSPRPSPRASAAWSSGVSWMLCLRCRRSATLTVSPPTACGIC